MRNLKKLNKYIVLYGILILQLMACGNGKEELELSTLDTLELSIGSALQEEESEIIEEQEEIWISVYICGAINTPGVYELQLGKRITDAIEMAGGFIEAADVEFWNLAQLLSDEEKIYVPTKDEVTEGYGGEYSGSDQSGIDASGKININTASKEQLMGLTGVGEAKAISIISYRENNGNFSVIEDIMKISGIKDAVFNTIKDYITV